MRDAGPSTEPRRSPRGRGRGLERLAVAGAAVCAAGLAFPWYRLAVGDRTRAGVHDFGFAHLALLITLGAAVFLVHRVGRGSRPPLPLHEGTLLALSGGWAGVICGFLMLARPTGRIISLPTKFGLSYGALISLGGAAILVLAGLRLRREELSRDRATAAPGPTSASPPLSPRSPS